MRPGLALELVVEDRGPGVGLLRRDEVRAIADRVVVVDRRAPSRGRSACRPSRFGRRSAAFGAHLGLGLVKVSRMSPQFFSAEVGIGLDLVGRDDRRQTLADRLPAVIGVRAGKQLGLRVREDRALAGHRLHARLRLEVGQDALLHRHRKSDRAQLLVRETRREGLLRAERRAHGRDSATPPAAPFMKLRRETLNLSIALLLSLLRQRVPGGALGFSTVRRAIRRPPPPPVPSCSGRRSTPETR